MVTDKMIQEQISYVDGTPINGGIEAGLSPHCSPSPLSNIRRPSAAYTGHTKRFSDGQRTDATQVPTSFSSGASEASNFSYKKYHTNSPDLLWPSPAVEPTAVEPRSSPNTRSVRSQKSKHTRARQEMAERISHPSIHINEHHQEVEIDEEDADHALWILFWLSALDPIHSLANCLFTLIVVFGLLIATPIRLIRGKSSLGDQIIRAIAPLFKHHLEMFYAPCVQFAHEWDFLPGKLVAVQLISPLVSIGVVLAAWTSAAFWVFTFIMGNPDGTERRDDGRDAVIAVRNWWERFFLKATRGRSIPSPERSLV